MLTEPFPQIGGVVLFPMQIWGMGESSRVEKKSWEDVIWWEAPESSIQGTYEEDVKDAHNAWPFPRSGVDVEDVEEDWKEDPCEVEQDGEEIVLFWRRACKSAICFS